MDSRELLVLLDGLPDVSNFKTWAHRGGDWPAAEVVQVRIANELMASRADGKGYTPDWIKTPADLQVEEDNERERQAAFKQAQDELMGRTRTRRRKAVS